MTRRLPGRQKGEVVAEFADLEGIEVQRLGQEAGTPLG
jgi:hypothetical protein